MTNETEDRYIVFISENVNEDIAAQKKTPKMEHENCQFAELKDGDEVNILHRFFTKNSIIREKLKTKLNAKGYKLLYEADMYLDDEHSMDTYHSGKSGILSVNYLESIHLEHTRIAKEVGAEYLRPDVYEALDQFELEMGLDVEYRNDIPQNDEPPF